VVELISVK